MPCSQICIHKMSCSQICIYKMLYSQICCSYMAMLVLTHLVARSNCFHVAQFVLKQSNISNINIVFIRLTIWGCEWYSGLMTKTYIFRSYRKHFLFQVTFKKYSQIKYGWELCSSSFTGEWRRSIIRYSRWKNQSSSACRFVDSQCGGGQWRKVHSIRDQQW